MTTLPFAALGDSVKVAATTTSGSVALGVAPATIRVLNATASVAFVSFGAGSATAKTDGDDSIPIAAGATEVFGAGSSITHAAAILVSGTGDVWFTPGDGV